ncbi:MAG TPA: AMP-binding protein, partial [Deinococcales bacterium]|nr:AMP-binding protein [Deinococcales bacterium]
MNIRFHAQLTPGRPAVHWQGRWTNFAELDAGIEGYARAAAAWGVREGDRLGLLGWNHPAHLHGLYAAERHGFVHVPLNHRLPPAVNASLLRDLGITHLAHTPGCAAAAQAIAAAHGSVQLHDVSEIEPAPLARAARLPARPDGETIMLLFTGGTTGTPKAAKITRRMFDANNADTVAAWGLTPDDSTVMATPMFHSGVNALATPLLSIGGRIAILESFKPAEYLALNAASGATILFSVPTMLNLLIQDPAFEDADFSGVRFAITGGSPCPGPVREAFTRRG